MSSVLFLSGNPQLRCSVQAVLTAARHTVTAGDPAAYQMTDQKFDCAVVDSGSVTRELVAQILNTGTRCVIGIYHCQDERETQMRFGVIWGIPADIDIADELKDGPLSVESAIAVSKVGSWRCGDRAMDRRRRRHYQHLRWWKGDEEGGGLRWPRAFETRLAREPRRTGSGFSLRIDITIEQGARC
jgi:hypothetical protein